MDVPTWALLSLIFAKLNGGGLARASCVSKGWREVGSQEELWRALCLQNWPSLSSPEGKTLLAFQGGSFRKFYALRAQGQAQHKKGFLGSSQLRPSLTSKDLFFLLDISHSGAQVFSSIVTGNHLLPSTVGDVTPDSPFDVYMPVNASMARTWSKEEIQEFEVSWAVTARGSPRIFQLLKINRPMERGVVVGNTCSYTQALPSPTICCQGGGPYSMHSESVMGSPLYSGPSQVQVRLECSCTRFVSTTASGSVYAYADFHPLKASFAIRASTCGACLSQAQVLSYLQHSLFHHCTSFNF